MIEANPSTASSVSTPSLNFELKTPKGTRDYGPYEMAIREHVISVITSIFKLHGAVTIDTPVFELKEVLMGKYGEDSKLIYDLQDQGGELCSLRYDLTVPFARFLAMNKQYGSMKRYHVAKVYRRDQPALTKGRYREFYQCDFDIAGTGMESMVPDAEVFVVIYEILTALGLGNAFTIKCNNRKILDGIFEVAGVPEKLFRPICSAVDKLDKQSWDQVKQEMLDKGLEESKADLIGEYVVKMGRAKGKNASVLAEKLLSDSRLMQSTLARDGVQEMLCLYKYLDMYGVSDKCSFDLSLARGLDYYTGVILEAVLEGAEVGSIAGGGRYDNLVGMFSKSGQQIPCVGATVGIERIFSILEAKLSSPDSLSSSSSIVRPSPTQVFVAAAGGELLEERMSLCKELWQAGISAELLPKRKVKPLDQFEYCEKQGIPLAVVLGPSELAEGKVKLRSIKDRQEQEILKSELLSTLKERLTKLNGSLESLFDNINL